MTQGIEKFEQVRELVESDAAREAEKILSDAREESERAIGEKKKSLLAAYREDVSRITEKFRAEENRRVSEKRTSEERRVLLHRAALTDRFFAEIADSLRSADSTDYLKRAAKKASEALALDSSSVVYCREGDVSAVKAAFSSCGAAVEATGEIKLGGFFVRSGNIFLDFSLDAALEREKEAFSRVKELQVSL